MPRELVLPTKLALSNEIEAEYKFLYAYISFRCSTRGYLWYENATLAEHMGKSTKSIERGLKALKDAKWIHIENRVKKGGLYHQEMRRVIWIYSDYLVALDKGGYGVAKPLPFRTWKTRFINAMLDNSKIPMVLYYFPTLEFMGSNRWYYEADTHKLYRFVGTGKELRTESLDKAESDAAFEKIYEFYKSRHKDQEPQKETFKQINDFKKFQDHIRENYIDKEIIKRDEKIYTINAIGMLMHYNTTASTPTPLNPDEALEMWQWMFQNQNEINIQGV